MSLWPALRDRSLHSVFSLVDWLYRTAMGRRDLPPWSLSYYVGCPADFESTGAELLAYLKLLARLCPNDRMLDIGCGCGMMALQLRGYLDDAGQLVVRNEDRPEKTHVPSIIHRPICARCARSMTSKLTT